MNCNNIRVYCTMDIISDELQKFGSKAGDISYTIAGHLHCLIASNNCKLLWLLDAVSET